MAKILVIDDDASARALLTTMLSYAGHELHEALRRARKPEQIFAVVNAALGAEVMPSPVRAGATFHFTLPRRAEFAAV
jgi:CheY-like chemotaxis protein